MERQLACGIPGSMAPARSSCRELQFLRAWFSGLRVFRSKPSCLVAQGIPPFVPFSWEGFPFNLNQPKRMPFFPMATGHLDRGGEQTGKQKAGLLGMNRFGIPFKETIGNRCFSSGSFHFSFPPYRTSKKGLQGWSICTCVLAYKWTTLAWW